MELVLRVREMLVAHPYGFLISVGEGERPHARLVAHAGVDDDLSIWIGTSPLTRKVSEVRRSGWATYAVEDRASFASVALSGAATVESDVGERKIRWTEEFRPFFPDGPDGDDFVLIHLAPQEIELIDFAHGIHPDPYGLVSQRYVDTPEGWSMSEPA
jgi:general stress protein 26